MEKETTTLFMADKSASEKDVSAFVTENAAPPAEEADSGTKEEGIHTTNLSDESVVDSPDNKTGPDTADSDKSTARAEFERLIKGDYREFYEERVRDNLNRRFRQNARAKKQNDENREIVEMLYNRYNIKEGDHKGLKKALESDDAYLAAEADKRGISVEDYKYIKRLEDRNRHLERNHAEFEAQRRAGEAVEKWYAESMKLRETYPDFDIFAESKNPSFVSLVQNGIDVRTAYEVVHHNDIVMEAQKTAAREAEQKTAEAIRQRATRPAENGLSQRSSALFANGVSSLTRAEREDIARRASRGEKITF